MKLTPIFSLPTSGARCTTLFTIESQLYVAFAQLAEDTHALPPNMNGGDSDTHSKIYIWRNQMFEPFQQLPVHGGEHIDFGLVNNIPMLAVANIRSGKEPDYRTDPKTQVFKWANNQFNLTQLIPSFAAKSTCFFKIDNQDFLGVSEGVIESETDKASQSQSHIYRWQDEQFKPFQGLNNVWGYDMTHFQIKDQHFLGIGDNITASKLYIWQKNQFQPLQDFAPHGGGRGFCYFEIDGRHYLAFANLLHESYLYQWNGQKFEQIQQFKDAGARSFHYAHIKGEHYLFRTNFITGSRDKPITKQQSIVYRWQDSQFLEDTHYTTYGGTDCKTFEDHGTTFLVVSNSLTEDIRFRVNSIIYQINV